MTVKELKELLNSFPQDSNIDILDIKSNYSYEILGACNSFDGNTSIIKGDNLMKKGRKK